MIKCFEYENNKILNIWNWVFQRVGAGGKEWKRSGRCSKPLGFSFFIFPLFHGPFFRWFFEQDSNAQVWSLTQWLRFSLKIEYFLHKKNHTAADIALFGSSSYIFPRTMSTLKNSWQLVDRSCIFCQWPHVVWHDHSFSNTLRC